jgi:2-polyprenyl-6-methoxyphenol hydroxylase-like FAD-dependent oxidoreductase
MVSVFLQLQATILLSNYISQGLASSVTIKPMVDVVICGGGLGGLALANGLINNGFSVACFEKNGEIWPTGAMTILKPNAFKALKDLKPELEKIMIDNGVKETVFGGTMYAWANIRNLLLPSDLDLHSSSTFVDLEDKEDSYIESRFLCKDHGIEKINTIRSRVFIGADGINSAVNKFLNGRQAKLSGSYSWRCTIDSAPDAIEGSLLFLTENM